ncbi:LysR family transcriptional regulator [Bradyrhizobium jicamae]|uniref:LysR family transcriptional regulator n=1 Tax=Bradyrhizobium jicamae TaxID=280332 RepID=UPI001BA77955|nr:LysR family transcriptional regulator [Bradyrhizobium jicamae]MBR0757926.1 LysR family transcriptional regulator [Bradyrhizobium jicamae]
MNEIDLRRFDLNLLVVFDVLMIERNVTRAAERLGRTQSAISHSLSRLRSQFGDPLLIKGGVRMQPTAFALDLIEQARPMLSGIQRVLSPTQAFDPKRSQRVFRVAAPDFALTLFAELLKRVRSEAPAAAVEWTAPRAPTLLEVAEGQIDIAIVPAELRWPPNVAGEPLGALGWRCFGRRDHPAFAKWGRANWTRWPHLVVRVGDNLTSPVNAASSAAGLTRTIGGWVPHFSAIAPILASSDLLATLPVAAMANAVDAYDLRSVKVPFPIAPLPHAMVWCSGRTRDPGLTWLRDRLRPVAKRNFAA